jgi:hypothetical protein
MYFAVRPDLDQGNREPTEVSNRDDFTCGDTESVRRHVKATGWRRIGIDGVDAVGRAHLARVLSRTLGCPALDVDDYLHRNQGGYIEFIDYPALNAAMSSMPAFILSGACLREVLANLGASLDGNIYIKRIRDGLWADEEGCVFPDGVDAAVEMFAANRALNSRYIDEMPEQAAAEDEEVSPHLVDEVMRYHDTWLPHETADLVFERDDDAS